jgi:hypothetical protein
MYVVFHWHTTSVSDRSDLTANGQHLLRILVADPEVSTAPIHDCLRESTHLLLHRDAVSAILFNFVLKEAMRSSEISSKGTNLIEQDNVQITEMK